jgi:hypothetical protein
VTSKRSFFVILGVAGALALVLIASFRTGATPSAAAASESAIPENPATHTADVQSELARLLAKLPAPLAAAMADPRGKPLDTHLHFIRALTLQSLLDGTANAEPDDASLEQELLAKIGEQVYAYSPPSPTAERTPGDIDRLMQLTVSLQVACAAAAGRDLAPSDRDWWMGQAMRLSAANHPAVRTQCAALMWALAQSPPQRAFTANERALFTQLRDTVADDQTWAQINTNLATQAKKAGRVWPDG